MNLTLEYAESICFFDFFFFCKVQNCVLAMRNLANNFISFRYKKKSSNTFQQIIDGNVNSTSWEREKKNIYKLRKQRRKVFLLFGEDGPMLPVDSLSILSCIAASDLVYNVYAYFYSKYQRMYRSRVEYIDTWHPHEWMIRCAKKKKKKQQTPN